jgi:hypothetical protein
MISKYNKYLKKDKLMKKYSFFTMSNSAVGIATSYGLDDIGVGVRVPLRSRIFTSPNRPDQLWGPPNLFNGYRGLILRG